MTDQEATDTATNERPLYHYVLTVVYQTMVNVTSYSTLHGIFRPGPAGTREHIFNQLMKDIAFNTRVPVRELTVLVWVFEPNDL